MKMLKVMIALAIVLNVNNVYSAIGVRKAEATVTGAPRSGFTATEVKPSAAAGVAVSKMKMLLDGLRAGTMNNISVWNDATGAPTDKWVNGMITIGNQVMIENPQVTRYMIMNNVNSALADAIKNRRAKGGSVFDSIIELQIGKIREGLSTVTELAATRPEMVSPAAMMKEGFINALSSLELSPSSMERVRSEGVTALKVNAMTIAEAKNLIDSAVDGSINKFKGSLYNFLMTQKQQGTAGKMIGVNAAEEIEIDPELAKQLEQESMEVRY
jgi:hypothetical protein